MAQSTSSAPQPTQSNRRTKLGLIFGAIAAIMTGVGYLGDIFDVYEFFEDRIPQQAQTETNDEPPRGVW